MQREYIGHQKIVRDEDNKYIIVTVVVCRKTKQFHKTIVDQFEKYSLASNDGTMAMKMIK